jgi:GTP-binding protein
VNGGRLRIVDLPGYGYAKVSKSESAKWGAMVEGYLKGRSALRKVVLLCDIRHEPSAMDVQMYEWLTYYGMDGLIVATKADKAPRSATPRCLQTIRNGLGAGPDAVIIPVSALKKTGAGELLAEIGKLTDLK